jgi:hypothetical protein
VILLRLGALMSKEGGWVLYSMLHLPFVDTLRRMKESLRSWLIPKREKINAIQMKTGNSNEETFVKNFIV